MIQEGDSISWEVDVPVATDPHVVGGLLEAVGGACLLMTIIISIITMTQAYARLEDILNVLKTFGAITGGLLALSWLITLVFFGNKYHARFTVTKKGVSFESVEKRAKGAARLALLMGIFSGRPGVAGSGLLAMSQESMNVTWKGVFKAIFNEKRRTIVLRNAWRKILVIYCREENYSQVADFVKTQMGSRKPYTGKSPLPSVILYSMLVVVACVPLFQLSQWPFEIDSFLPILILSFSLATILFVPLFGYVVIGAVALQAAIILVGPVSQYRHLLDTNDWISLLLAFLGMTCLVWISIQSMRWKIRSLLMADAEDMS
jgi:hypothetical protein